MGRKRTPSLSDIALSKDTLPTPAAVQPSKKAEETVKKRRGQTLRLTEGAWKQLKHLAVDRGVPAHTLLLEAVNDLFIKYGKPPIA